VSRPAREMTWLRSELLEIRSAVALATSSASSACSSPVDAGEPVAFATAPWWLQAACRGRPTSWWFPAKGDSFAFAVAKSICRGCPVKAACLADALEQEADLGFPSGIRGGVTAQQRAVMLQRRLSR
jgi:Transcription factor WhiB